MQERKKRARGFTLIELLVAATILAVLAAIGIVSFGSANRKARDGKRKADMEQLRAALEIYRTDNSGYPVYAAATSDGADWVSLMTDLNDYLTSQAITDPKNVTPFLYSYDSDGVTYQVCAVLEETDNPSYCLDSP